MREALCQELRLVTPWQEVRVEDVETVYILDMNHREENLPGMCFEEWQLNAVQVGGGR